MFLRFCQLSSATDKMYCQPAYCNDCKSTEEMNKVGTFSKLCPEDHVLVASSASNSTSNVALNAIDLNLIFNRENKRFSIPDCDFDNLRNLTEYNMLSPTSCKLLLPTTALRIHLQYCPSTYDPLFTHLILANLRPYFQI